MAHEGWLASFEVVGPEPVGEPSVVNLPLIGISANRADHNGTISITVARSAGERLTRVIDGVAHMYVDQSDDGATTSLVIESADGTRTTIHLRAMPLRPRQASVGDPPLGA
jgi:hypothetical protein